jgi:histidyl-tRNA synthetase
MHFLDAEKILKVAKDKILEDFLYKRYLVELPLMDKNNYMSFEEYKQKIFELVRMKNRTKEEKEKDLEIARQKAKNAMKLLDQNKDFHKPRIKKSQKPHNQKVSKFIK